MKLTIITFTLAVCALFKMQAQELEKSLLWEISGNGLTNSSYIYGTIHMTCNATLDAATTKALEDTTLLVLEIDMDDPSMQAKMMKGVYMKNNTNIKDLVTTEEYELISKFIKEQTGLPIEALSTMKPFFLTAMFYPKLLNCTTQSYEETLMAVAHKQGEEVLGLETIEEQLNVFDSIPYKDQAEDLLDSAKDNLAYDTQAFEKLMTLYNSKDIEGMITMMAEDESRNTSKHMDKMLDNRNKNWIPKIEEFAKSQATFFGVGAAHLAGEDGVIKLLRAAGYTVNAVQ